MDNWFLIVLICLSGLRIGGKDSTDYVVKGTHKKLSQELIDELKTICQVFFWLIELLCIGSIYIYVCVCVFAYITSCILRVEWDMANVFVWVFFMKRALHY